MRFKASFAVACVVLLAGASGAKAATFVYEGLVSSATQDAWTLRDGSALQQSFRVRVTIESPLQARLQMRSYVIGGSENCYPNDADNNDQGGMNACASPDDSEAIESGEIPCCPDNSDEGDIADLPSEPLTSHQAALGSVSAEVWQLNSDGSSTRVGEEHASLIAKRDDFGKDVAIKAGLVHFHEDAEVDVALPGLGTLQIFNFFGDPVTLTVSNDGSATEVSSAGFAQSLSPYWQIVSEGSPSLFFAGTLRLEASH